MRNNASNSPLPGVTGRRPAEFQHVILILLVASALAGPRGANASPAPPPGGHLPISYGGDNRPGYPPLSMVGVGEPDGPGVRELRFTASPNPFRTLTTLRFVLKAEHSAQVRFFTSTGRVVREIGVPAGQAGWQTVVWDGRDEEGRSLPSGIYFFRIETNAASTRPVSGHLVLIR